MVYLKRKADHFLHEWKKNTDRYPLIIKGARQVGKTATIRKFAEEQYAHVVEINFITEPVYKTTIEEGFSADSVIKLISRIDPSKHFEPENTLIFFDEIQDFPEIATSLKFFKEDEKALICEGQVSAFYYLNRWSRCGRRAVMRIWPKSMQQMTSPAPTVSARNQRAPGTA